MAEACPLSRSQACVNGWWTLPATHRRLFPPFLRPSCQVSLDFGRCRIFVDLVTCSWRMCRVRQDLSADAAARRRQQRQQHSQQLEAKAHGWLLGVGWFLMPAGLRLWGWVSKGSSLLAARRWTLTPSFRQCSRPLLSTNILDQHGSLPACVSVIKCTLLGVLEWVQWKVKGETRDHLRYFRLSGLRPFQDKPRDLFATLRSFQGALADHQQQMKRMKEISERARRPARRVGMSCETRF